MQLKWYRKKYVRLCGVDREQESVSTNDKANGQNVRLSVILRKEYLSVFRTIATFLSI